MRTTPEKPCRVTNFQTCSQTVSSITYTKSTIPTEKNFEDFRDITLWNVINQIQHRLLAFPSQNAAGFKGVARENLKPCMSLNYINRLGIPLELYCSVLCGETWAYRQAERNLQTTSVRIFFGWENSTITVQDGSYETSSQVNFGMAWRQMYLGRFFSVVHHKLK